MSLLPPDFATDALGLEPIFFILGPCAYENHQHCVEIASVLAEMGKRIDRLVVFKVSFDKANRTSLHSYRGNRISEAIKTFDYIRNFIKMPIITDVHEPLQCDLIAPHVDIIQIPAFLCRQTDLLTAAGATGLPVNIKKGQFLSPYAMSWAAEKVRAGGGRPLACERGTFFGYSELVNDFRSIQIMRKSAAIPIVYDATHSVQVPGGVKEQSGGDRSTVLDLARAAVAIGIDGLFLETDKYPDLAPCDGSSMVPLDRLEDILAECVSLDDFVKAQLRARPKD